jgi:hypothetical protein
VTDRPISLSKARKARARADAKRQADANAARFGRTKAQKASEADDRARAARTLEAHRRDEEE